MGNAPSVERVRADWNPVRAIYAGDSVSRADFDVAEAADAYWTGRWGYLSRAIFHGGLGAWFGGVLEVGTGGFPLFRSSARLDLWDRGDTTHVHDARLAPWPFADDAFGAVFALQVFEHLGPDFGVPFREALRVGRRLILSVPYRWDCPDDPLHHGLDEDTLAEWFGQVPLRLELLDADTVPRLIAVYERQAQDA